MGRILIGYYIGNDVQFEIAHKKLSCFDAKGRSVRNYILRETMMRLFLYLLEHANQKVVTNEQILYNVWDLHGLKSSNQRMWQVMQALRFRLVALGISYDFIQRIETGASKGYMLNHEFIRPYYFHTDNVVSQR